MWEKIKAFLDGCARSTTMWFSVALPAAASWVFGNWDSLSTLILDPQLSDELKSALPADPAVLSILLKVMAGVTFVTRARSILKTSAR